MDTPTTLALIILAALGVAAVVEMSIEAAQLLIGRRIEAAEDSAYEEGYAEGLAVAGRAFNADKVRWSA